MAFLAARSEVDFGGGGGVFERDVVLDANGEADDVAAAMGEAEGGGRGDQIKGLDLCVNRGERGELQKGCS